MEALVFTVKKTLWDSSIAVQSAVVQYASYVNSELDTLAVIIFSKLRLRLGLRGNAVMHNWSEPRSLCL